jgi:hypothetical protein
VNIPHDSSGASGSDSQGGADDREALRPFEELQSLKVEPPEVDRATAEGRRRLAFAELERSRGSLRGAHNLMLIAGEKPESGLLPGPDRLIARGDIRSIAALQFAGAEDNNAAAKASMAALQAYQAARNAASPDQTRAILRAAGDIVNGMWNNPDFQPEPGFRVASDRYVEDARSMVGRTLVGHDPLRIEPRLAEIATASVEERSEAEKTYRETLKALKAGKPDDELAGRVWALQRARLDFELARFYDRMPEDAGLQREARTHAAESVKGFRQAEQNAWLARGLELLARTEYKTGDPNGLAYPTLAESVELRDVVAGRTSMREGRPRTTA